MKFLFLMFALCALTMLPLAHASTVQMYGRWTNPDFKVYVDNSCNAQWRSLIDNGFKTWQSGFSFNYHYVATSLKQDNTAYFYCDGVFPVWKSGDGTFPWTSWDLKTEQNGVRIFNSTFTMLSSYGSYAFFIAWIAVHEEGHVLGIATDSEPNSLMSHDGKSTFTRSLTPSTDEYNAVSDYYSLPVPETPTPILILMFSSVFAVSLKRASKR